MGNQNSYRRRDPEPRSVGQPGNLCLAGDFANARADALRRYCREACARAGDFATDAFASALKGIFPAKHSPMNLLYCDITLSPPPLSGPEPLSTARLKQASHVGVWLSRANAGIVTPGTKIVCAQARLPGLLSSGAFLHLCVMQQQGTANPTVC